MQYWWTISWEKYKILLLFYLPGGENRKANNSGYWNSFFTDVFITTECFW